MTTTNNTTAKLETARKALALIERATRHGNPRRNIMAALRMNGLTPGESGRAFRAAQAAGYIVYRSSRWQWAA